MSIRRLLQASLVVCAFLAASSCNGVYSLIYPTVELEVTNELNEAVDGVFMAESGTDEWGPNLLASPILPGASATLSGILRADYDLYAETQTGYIVFVESLDLTAVEQSRISIAQ